MAVETVPAVSTMTWLGELQLRTLNPHGGFIDSRGWRWTRLEGVGLGFRVRLPNQHIYNTHPSHADPVFYAVYRSRGGFLPMLASEQVTVVLHPHYPSFMDFTRDLVHRIQIEEAERGS